jgi:hypothetical protein
MINLHWFDSHIISEIIGTLVQKNYVHSVVNAFTFLTMVILREWLFLRELCGNYGIDIPETTKFNPFKNHFIFIYVRLTVLVIPLY